MRDADSTKIKTLTKRTKQGDVYIRRPDVKLQIEKILTLEKPQILAMIGGYKRRYEADYLIDETIVYSLPEAKIENDNDTIENLYKELNRRICKLLAEFRVNFRNNQVDFEDFGQQAGLTIIKKFHSVRSHQ